MPRVRRIAIDQYQGYSRRIVEKLLTGNNYVVLEDKGIARRIRHDDELREPWANLREELLEGFISEHPGRRPWAWWRFERPGDRLQIADGPEPCGPSDTFGKPSRFDGVPPEGMFETEEAFLRRYDLLSEAELAALAK